MAEIFARESSDMFHPPSPEWHVWGPAIVPTMENGVHIDTRVAESGHERPSRARFEDARSGDVIERGFTYEERDCIVTLK
jgi:hypothetical protein